MTIGLTFDSLWLSSDGGIHKDAVESTIKEFIGLYGKDVLITSKNPYGFSMELNSSEVNETKVVRILKEAIENVTELSIFSRNYTITVSEGEYEPEGKDNRDKKENSPVSESIESLIKKNLTEAFGKNGDQKNTDTDTAGAESAPDSSSAQPPENDSEDKKAEILERIDALVGNTNFKELCREIALRSDTVLKNGTQEFFFSEVCLFSIDEGYGFNTAKNLLNELLVAAKLFADPSEPMDFKLPARKGEDGGDRLEHASSPVEMAMRSQKIITVDITPQIGYTDTKGFKQYLMKIFQNNKNCFIIFRIPYVKNRVLDEIKRDIHDIIPVRTVVFEPFEKEELRDLAVRFLKPYGISFSEEAFAEFDKRIEAERRDGYFYGIQSVKKIIAELVKKLELESIRKETASKVITPDIATPDETAEEEDDVPSFDSLIGMDGVVDKLKEIIAQITYARTYNMGSKPCMHMAFVGNPGTGKTTIARILGAELKKAGILRIGRFYEHRGRDFCGEYVGHTAPKTTALCQQAYGSVLFIDEAYSLNYSDSDRDYGKEAIDTLIAEMENHYSDLLVIFAGYPDEIERMIEQNPGMRSRVPYFISFPSYTREQLYQIFEKMSSQHFRHAPGFDERAKEFFDNLPQELLDSKSFGNARYVRNVYERVWSKAILRTQEENSPSIELKREDFEAAEAEFFFASEKEEKKPPIGFGID